MSRLKSLLQSVLLSDATPHSARARQTTPKCVSAGPPCQRVKHTNGWREKRHSHLNFLESAFLPQIWSICGTFCAKKILWPTCFRTSCFSGHACLFKHFFFIQDLNYFLDHEENQFIVTQAVLPHSLQYSAAVGETPPSSQLCKINSSPQSQNLWDPRRKWTTCRLTFRDHQLRLVLLNGCSACKHFWELPRFTRNMMDQNQPVSFSSATAGMFVRHCILGLTFLTVCDQQNIASNRPSIFIDASFMSRVFASKQLA